MVVRFGGGISRTVARWSSAACEGALLLATRLSSGFAVSRFAWRRDLFLQAHRNVEIQMRANSSLSLDRDRLRSGDVFWR